MICASLQVESLEQAREGMREAREAGADLCELRLDTLGDATPEALLADKPLPVMATCRPEWEGGKFEGTEADRVGLLEEACLHGADYVDLEFRAFKDIRRRQAQLVLSYHDFNGVPQDLERIVSKMRMLEPFLLKVACLTRGGEDLVRLVRLQKSLGVPGAVVAMGEAGVPLRALYFRYGGFLTYAAVRPGGATAPGQLTVGQLVREYRVKSIDESTEVYAAVGEEKTPGLFNGAFEKLGMNARCVGMRLDDPSLLGELVEALELRGVTAADRGVLGVRDERGENADTVVVREGRLTGNAEPDVALRFHSLFGRAMPAV
jgi:3-dehydroquinate dehydratase/shikimate dehydrogenase